MTAPVAPDQNTSEDKGVHTGLTCFAFAMPASQASGQTLAVTRPGEVPGVLSGRYRLERLLGAGGMGKVYLACDLLSEQFGDPDPYLAVKILNEELAGSPDACALLYSEFALTRRMRHHNLLRLYSFEVDLGCQQAFMTMEVVRGLTLDRLICERPLGLPWSELKSIALSLLDAVSHIHACGVLHGDIKPGNVLLGEDGLRLFDFGLGQAQWGELASLPHLNRDRFQAWTPVYAAPELLEGHPLTPQADIFGAACVIYELAGGKLPHPQSASTLGDRPLQRPSHFPARAWPALRKALEHRLADRSTSAARLREALSGTQSWLQRLMP